VKHEFCEYVLSDSSPKMLETAKRKITDPRVKMVLQQGEVLPYPDGTFDRIIASHVLEHIYKPHLAIREWCRVLRKGGVLTLILPCDPGLAWRLGKSLGPRRRVEKMGLPYDYLSALEHVNPIGNLVAIIHYHFDDFREYWWPFVVPSIDINLIYCVNIFI
jgi:SAM-dependent methyltransferase